MSRRLGRIEQAVLRLLRENPVAYTWLADVRDALCPPWPDEPAPTEQLTPERVAWVLRQYVASVPVRACRQAVDRAVRSLERKGLVRSGMYRYGRGHRKAVWLAERAGPPARADLGGVLLDIATTLIIGGGDAMSDFVNAPLGIALAFLAGGVPVWLVGWWLNRRDLRRQQLWELEQQIREEVLPAEERAWREAYRARQADIKREARRRLGLAAEEET
jgi:hypothetical protein